MGAGQGQRSEPCSAGEVLHPVRLRRRPEVGERVTPVRAVGLGGRRCQESRTPCDTEHDRARRDTGRHPACQPTKPPQRRVADIGRRGTRHGTPIQGREEAAEDRARIPARKAAVALEFPLCPSSPGSRRQVLSAHPKNSPTAVPPRRIHARGSCQRSAAVALASLSAVTRAECGDSAERGRPRRRYACSARRHLPPGRQPARRRRERAGTGRERSPLPRSRRRAGSSVSGWRSNGGRCHRPGGARRILEGVTPADIAVGELPEAVRGLAADLAAWASP